MDSYPSIEDPALVPDRTLTPLYTLFNNNLLRPVISIEGTKILLRGAYHGFQNLVSDYIGTHPASGIATSEVWLHMTHPSMSGPIVTELLPRQLTSTLSLATTTRLRTVSWNRP